MTSSDESDIRREIRASRREMLERKLRGAAELGRLYEEELSRVGTPGHEGRLQQREATLLNWVRFVRELMPDWPISASDIESHHWGEILSPESKRTR